MERVKNEAYNEDGVDSRQSIEPIIAEDLMPNNAELRMQIKSEPGGRYLSLGETTCATNTFGLDLSGAVDEVYRYELKLLNKLKDGTLVDLSKGRSDDATSVRRTHILWSIYDTALKNGVKYFGTDSKQYYYDCTCNLYSITRLWNGTVMEQELFLAAEILSESVRNFLGRSSEGVILHLIRNGSVLVRLPTSSLFSTSPIREENLRLFLSTVLMQCLYRSQDRFFIYGTQAFERPSPGAEAIEGKVSSKGISLQICFTGTTAQRPSPVVQVAAKRTALFMEMQLLTFITNVFSDADILEKLKTDEKDRKRITRYIRGLTVRPTHLKSLKTFPVFGMTVQSAEKVEVLVNGEVTTVAAYFDNKYKVRLLRPDLPCIIERRRTRTMQDSQSAVSFIDNYYPIELLKVVKGQRVKTEKQTSLMNSALIRNYPCLSSTQLEDDLSAMKSAGLDNNNQYLQRLRIRINEQPMSRSGVVRYPPSVAYDKHLIDLSSNKVWDWRSLCNDQRFWFPVHLRANWCIIVFNKAIDESTFRRFKQALLQSARRCGLRLPYPSEKWYECTDEEYIVDELRRMKRRDTGYVLFISHDSNISLHDVMKLSEVNCKVVTQHVKASTVQRAVMNKRGANIINNILFKMNLKLGGITHSLATSPLFENANGLQRMLENNWLCPSRMFVGLELWRPLRLHPSDLPTKPAIVGFAFSCGLPFYVQGTYWMQHPTLPSISRLTDYMKNALEKHIGRSEAMPTELVIFRGSLNGRVISEIATDEVTQLRDAVKKVADSEKTKVRLTYIVVEKCIDLHLFKLPLNPNASSVRQNVPPGMCIDEGTVRASGKEFLIVPHSSPKGPSRILKCTAVVDDEPAMSLDDLEEMTNVTCYLHETATSPISEPAYLYSAKELVKRAEKNWNTMRNGEEDERGNKFGEPGSEEYFSQISSVLDPKLPHKFWA